MFEDARDVSRGVQFVKPRCLFLCKYEGRMVEFVDYIDSIISDDSI